ncbi:hypothetical protein DOS84_18135 [Flavobacterium aquariorum]|uniref:Uncharacterized protein n=1 Tax=Flavobacterium aquariorum TaxID=2217670 RepID=A0A2W7TNI5_9FLAO|nr:hypothetical protein [Flavobacterium aquariorum]PZX92013.1 hypothetical protein DOS84_18135 [Flavobacterium aquariorum]
MKSIFTFFLDEKSNKKIKPEYFYTKNHRADFPYRNPSRSCWALTRGLLPTASAQILTVILWCKNIRATKRRFQLFISALFEEDFFFCLDTKETKDQALIFLHKKSSDGFLYRAPSRFARGALPAANAQILTVIFNAKI